MTDAHSRSRRILRTSTAFGIAGLVGNVGQLAYTAVTARAVGPAMFAPYAAALLALNLGSLATTAGLASAILRAPEWDRARERGLITMALLVGSLAGAAMLFCGSAWERISGVAGSGDIVRACAPLTLAVPLGLIGMAIVRRDGRGPWAATAEAVAQIGGFVVGAIAVTITRSTLSLLVATFTSTALMIALTWGSLRRFPMVGRPRAASDEIAFAARMIPFGFSSFFLIQMPTLWAGRTLSADLYARFFRGNIIDGILSIQLIGVISKAAGPEYRSIEPERRGHSVTQLVVLSWSVAALVFALLAGAADPVVAVLLGPAWAGTGTWVAATAVVCALSVPAALLAGYAEFSANYRVLYASQVLGFLLMMGTIGVCSLLSITPFGPVFAGVALYGGLVLFSTILLRRSLDLAGAARTTVVQTGVALAAFLVVKGSVAVGGTLGGGVGEILGSVLGGAAVVAVVALFARRLPAGRLLAERHLLPSWLPGSA